MFGVLSAVKIQLEKRSNYGKVIRSFKIVCKQTTKSYDISVPGGYFLVYFFPRFCV